MIFGQERVVLSTFESWSEIALRFNLGLQLVIESQINLISILKIYENVRLLEFETWPDYR